MKNSFIHICLLYRRVFLCALVACFGLYWRFEVYLKRDLWLDELNQLKNTVGGLLPFWEQLNYGERTCFPGEYLLTWPFVQLAPQNKWIITIPHIIFAVFGFFVLYWLCCRYFRTTTAFVITFLVVALNRNLVFHAFEFRPYSVLATLGILVFLLAGRLIRDRDSLSSWKRWGICLLFVATVFYHNYGALIVFFACLYHILDRGEDSRPFFFWRRSLPELVPTAIVSLAIFLWYHTGTSFLTYEFTSGGGMNTFDYIPNPVGDPDRFYRTVMGNLLGYKQYGFKILGLGILFAWFIPHKDRLRQIGFLFLLVILPIEIQLFGDLHTGYWFLQRQFVWVMPLYAFLIGWSWDAIVVFIKEIIMARNKKSSLGGGL